MALDLVHVASQPEVDQINSEILLALDTHPHASVMFDAAKVPPHIRAQAEEYLTAIRDKNAVLLLCGTLGVKALPFWRSVAVSLNLRTDYLMMLRHPLQGSLVDMSQWLIMWASHWIHVIEDTHGCQRMVVSQELLQNGLAGQLERVNALLSLSINESAEINRFLAASMTVGHPRVDAKVLKTVPYGMELYDCLYKVARDELQFDSVEFAARWRAIMQEFVTTAPMYAFIDTLLMDQTMLEFRLYYIRQSWLWRMLSPLRTLDDALRQKRRLSKLQDRVITSHA